MTNQKRGKYFYEPMRTLAKLTKLLEARENAGIQVVFGFSFASDWLKSGTSFLDQSQSEVKQKKKLKLIKIKY